MKNFPSRYRVGYVEYGYRHKWRIQLLLKLFSPTNIAPFFKDKAMHHNKKNSSVVKATKLHLTLYQFTEVGRD